jgi:hypothetical protein
MIEISAISGCIGYLLTEIHSQITMLHPDNARFEPEYDHDDSPMK